MLNAHVYIEFTQLVRINHQNYMHVCLSCVRYALIEIQNIFK